MQGKTEPKMLQELSRQFLEHNGYSASEIEEYYTVLRKFRQRYSSSEQFAPEPKEYYLQASDGVNIFVREFIPPNVKALLLCQHGNQTQADLYFPLADHLYDKNIGMIAVDNPGHGRSGPDRGDLDHPERIFPIYDQILARFPNIPHHLMGESLGTTMMAYYLSKKSSQARKVASVILMVCPYKLRAWIMKPLSPVLQGILGFIELLSARFAFLPFKPDFRPSYFYEYHKLDQIDRIRGPKTSARHLRNALNLIRLFPARAHEIRKPTLILEGTDDQFIDPIGSLELAHRMTHTYRKVHLYKGADHSLFFDKHSQRVYDDIIHWILFDYKKHQG